MEEQHPSNGAFDFDSGEVVELLRANLDTKSLRHHSRANALVDLAKTRLLTETEVVEGRQILLDYIYRPMPRECGTGQTHKVGSHKWIPTSADIRRMEQGRSDEVT